MPQTGHLAGRHERAAKPVLKGSAISALETCRSIDTTPPVGCSDEIDPHRSAKSARYRDADDPPVPYSGTIPIQNMVERTAAPVAQPIGVAASPETACEGIVCVAAGWSRR